VPKGEEDMSSYSEGQTHQLADALEMAGFKGGDLTKLGQSQPTLALIRGVLQGTHEIKPIDHVIDLSAPARLPFDGASLEVHRGEGIVKLERRSDDLYLDGKKLNLFVSKKQKGGIVGHELRKELEKRGGNVSTKVLDHLVDHPDLWPESWKKDKDGNTVYVFFWDDIFRDPKGHLCVRYGYWREGRVVSSCGWLDRGWSGRSPAASLAS
jgi:hypothetical protein